MSFVQSAKDTMLNALTVTQVSAHTAFPGLTGVNEVTGGTYARVSATFASSSGAVRSLSSGVSFAIPAATTVRWLGLWNGTSYIGYSPNAANPKEFIVDTATSTVTCTAHGYVNTNKIVFYGDTVPAGLVEGTVYFVLNATTNGFQVAATSGGTAIALTTVGGSACVVSSITEEVYASAGTHTISAWSLGLPN